MTVIAPDWEVATGNDTTIGDFGQLALCNVRTRGQVLLPADGAVRRGHVDLAGLAVGVSPGPRAGQSWSTGGYDKNTGRAAD